MPEESNKTAQPEEQQQFYSQLQPWSTLPATPCMDPEPLVGHSRVHHKPLSYKTPRPSYWRPTLGFENISCCPLPSQPVTNNMVNPCYTPFGMSTEPLRFPNLVTGFERNPAHAARAALNTRYTPEEWAQTNLSTFNESDTIRNYSQRLRSDFIRTMRETDEKTAEAQLTSGRTIGERVTDLKFWRNEASTELELLVMEANALNEALRSMEKSVQDMEAPLHIAQECLFQREKREGIDLVHDAVEEALFNEIQLIRNGQERMRNLIQKAKEQQRNNRSAQHLLETDVRSKEGALGIDSLCHQMNNFSSGIQYYGGVENYDPTVSTTESWAENSNTTVKKSQTERGKSSQLRSDIHNLINVTSNEVWEAWGATNNALARRAAESMETKSKLQMHLQRINQEIFDVEKNMELLRKALTDKTPPMKVAQSRLEARSHRRGIENCRDEAQNKLVKEVKLMQGSIDQLHRKLQEAESQLQQLLKTRDTMEIELMTKVNSLFIDKEKCLGMRRSYPITATIKY